MRFKSIKDSLLKPPLFTQHVELRFFFKTKMSQTLRNDNKHFTNTRPFKPVYGERRKKKNNTNTQTHTEACSIIELWIIAVPLQRKRVAKVIHTERMTKERECECEI